MTTTSNFAPPVDQRYLHDYIAGSAFEFGTISLSEYEIIDFARRFDPQPIHTDAQAAGHGPFGGLIASGWHTGSVMMRLFTDYFLSHVASIASPGVDEVRWLLPVRPGDALSIRVTILEVKQSRSKPDRGTVKTFVEVLNQKREVVMSLRGTNILRAEKIG